METHPDAGAAGVKMFNGSGKLLPESKRAFPGPRTAFFKILGLSYLFPKSRLFNNYYLGHLNNDETTKADILTGAFMFLRREAFEKTGFLDEDFFMFGEDIDYCYRLKLKGFNNYYYPKVKIIHFKGESTKKEDLIVIRNFYSAMEIFVRKHFNKGKYQFVTLPIYIAIYFTATLALTKRLLIRVIYQFYDAPPAKKHKTVVVSDHEGYSGVLELVNKSGTSNKITGRISPLKNDTKPHLLGDIDQIREVITTNGIKEVIFTTRGLTYSQLIDCMHQISDLDTKIRIASEHERFLTGNKYVYPSN
jgi:GT2 family glycosyltransferase